jgi:hypothetical protein
MGSDPQKQIAVPVDRWPSAAALELIITVNYEATSGGSDARCPAACSREIQVRAKVLDDVRPACAGAAGYTRRRGLMDHRPVRPAESRTTSATGVRAPQTGPGRRAVGDPPDPRDLGPDVRQSWSSGRRWTAPRGPRHPPQIRSWLGPANAQGRGPAAGKRRGVPPRPALLLWLPTVTGTRRRGELCATRVKRHSLRRARPARPTAVSSPAIGSVAAVAAGTVTH